VRRPAGGTGPARNVHQREPRPSGAMKSWAGEAGPGSPAALEASLVVTGSGTQPLPDPNTSSACWICR